ncbi:hypothetical protein HBB16_09525 [Pseudonocardia sp. MCCB 268]|nr:hypothetical protein [Pseudonocardia cytotoxica]
MNSWFVTRKCCAGYDHRGGRCSAAEPQVVSDRPARAARRAPGSPDRRTPARPTCCTPRRCPTCRSGPR